MTLVVCGVFSLVRAFFTLTIPSQSPIGLCWLDGQKKHCSKVNHSTYNQYIREHF